MNVPQLNADGTETFRISPDHVNPKVHISFFVVILTVQAAVLELLYNYNLWNISKCKLLVSKAELEKILNAFISSLLGLL